MTKIYEVDQVSRIGPATGRYVELYDHDVSLGQVSVDDDGSWTKAVSNLALGTHTYTAKAANGMPASEPWEIQVQQVQGGGENFDAVPDTVLTRGQKIDMPSMTITFSQGDGRVAILPFDYGDASNFPPLPGRREGKTLHMNLNAIGEDQVVTLDFNRSYSRLSFWSSYADYESSATFYGADGSRLGGISLPVSGSEARQSTFAGSNIRRVVFLPQNGDWIVLDHFQFE